MSDRAPHRGLPPPGSAAPAATELPVSGRYAPAEYFPEAAGWPAAQLRRHLEYATDYERRTGLPFPRPWRTPEDARGWRVAARGRDWPALPEADVELAVPLSPDDYVWVARRAAAARLRPSAFVARLVAAARSEDAGDGRGNGTPPPPTERERHKTQRIAEPDVRTDEAAGDPQR